MMLLLHVYFEFETEILILKSQRIDTKKISSTNIYLGRDFEMPNLDRAQDTCSQASHISMVSALASQDKAAQGRTVPHDWQAPQITHWSQGIWPHCGGEK